MKVFFLSTSSQVHLAMSNAKNIAKPDIPVALITGATGFVGSNLVQLLLREGWEVHIVSRKGTQVPDVQEFVKVVNHTHDGSIEGMIELVGDAKPSVVFHLASLFISQHESKDVEKLILNNVLFGNQLLEAMKVNNIRRIVNTGTSWQHYENKVYSPVNLYAATKQAFEVLMQYYIEANGLQAITLKLFDTYGYKDPRPKLINLLKKVAEKNQTLVMSPGEQEIDLVHVDDVVRAFEKAATRLLGCDVKGYESYAVGTGKPIKLHELVGVIEQKLGRKLPIVWGGRPYRAREVMEPWNGAFLPGWEAKINVAQFIPSMFVKLNSESDT
jgi:nucleoside-diphosphate-sugar epimerase